MSHEPLLCEGSFFADSPKNHMFKFHIRVFNDTYVIAMLQMLNYDHVRQLSGAPGLTSIAETSVIERHIRSGLTYRTYNEAVKSAAANVDHRNAHFTTHAARIGSRSFSETKDIGAIKLAGKRNSQKSAKQYIGNGRTAIAALDITTDHSRRY